MIDGECWMFEWIDEFDIASASTAKRAFESPTAMERLFELAVESNVDFATDEYSSQPMLVAGQGLNLAAETTCGRAACRIAEVDNAISKAWHYFDKVVVAGPDPESIFNAIANEKKGNRKYLHWKLLNDIALLLHLRETGATSRLAFVPNNFDHCEDCGRKEAEEMGLVAAYDKKVENEIVSQLERRARISIRKNVGIWSAAIEHEFLAEPMQYRFAKRPTRRQVAQKVFDTHCYMTVRDYTKAKAMKMPLAAVAGARWIEEVKRPADDSTESRMGRVALELKMPYIDGLTGKDLLAAIEDERPHFVRFQQALRKAIEENVKRLDTRSDHEIAEAVTKEFIEPALQDIKGRLRSTRKTLGKKTATGFSIGAVTTAIGLTGAMPLVIATGVAAVATTLPQVYKYFDDSSSIEMSDMYFLWTLNKRTHNPV